MKEIYAALVYFSIGLGVVAVFGERNNKPVPDAGVVFVLAVFWPALITVEVYRATAPAKEKAA